MKNKEREEELFLLTKKLRQTLPVCRPVNSSHFEDLFNKKKYAELISEMKRHMGIFCKLSVKYISTDVSEGKSPAYVLLPDFFPAFGSTTYTNMTISLVFYADLLKSFHKFSMMIAHELSHVVLHSINHPLKKSEEATDIAAMILGFSREYELGHTTFFETETRKILFKVGYLTFEEVIYVLSIIES